jgi:hypothetical protein
MTMTDITDITLISWITNIFSKELEKELFTDLSEHDEDISSKSLKEASIKVIERLDLDNIIKEAKISNLNMGYFNSANN